MKLFMIFGILVSTASFASISGGKVVTSLGESNRYVVQGEGFEGGVTVRFYKIKENCRWPSTVSVNDEACKQTVANGKIVKSLENGSAVAQSDTAVQLSGAIFVERI